MENEDKKVAKEEPEAADLPNPEPPAKAQAEDYTFTDWALI